MCINFHDCCTTSSITIELKTLAPVTVVESVVRVSCVSWNSFFVCACVRFSRKRARLRVELRTLVEFGAITEQQEVVTRQEVSHANVAGSVFVLAAVCPFSVFFSTSVQKVSKRFPAFCKYFRTHSLSSSPCFIIFAIFLFSRWTHITAEEKNEHMCANSGIGIATKRRHRAWVPLLARRRM